MNCSLWHENYVSLHCSNIKGELKFSAKQLFQKVFQMTLNRRLKERLNIQIVIIRHSFVPRWFTKLKTTILGINKYSWYVQHGGQLEDISEWQKIYFEERRWSRKELKVNLRKVPDSPWRAFFACSRDWRELEQTSSVTEVGSSLWTYKLGRKSCVIFWNVKTGADRLCCRWKYQYMIMKNSSRVKKENVL